jgi:hypothetical protein
MKLNRILIIAVFSGLAFTSCRNNERGIDDDDRVEIEADRNADLRTNQQGMTDENSVSMRVQRNQKSQYFQ